MLAECYSFQQKSESIQRNSDDCRWQLGIVSFGLHVGHCRAVCKATDTSDSYSHWNTPRFRERLRVVSFASCLSRRVVHFFICEHVFFSPLVCWRHIESSMYDEYLWCDSCLLSTCFRLQELIAASCFCAVRTCCLVRTQHTNGRNIRSQRCIPDAIRS